jgi:DNA-binding transcriptional LysR family regulator
MLEIRELRLVCAINDEGSLTRAARVLGMGQSAVTRALATLEGRLGGELFERNRRGMMPTDLCRAFLPDAEEILNHLKRLDRHLPAVRGEQQKTLTIAAGAYAAESIGMVAAARMLAIYPTIRLRLISASWADVPRMVQEREASIGVVDLREFTESPDLVSEPLRPQPGVFVVRPGHPLTELATVQLADVLAWPVVLLGRLPRLVQAPMAEAREQARATGRLHPAFPALIHESPTIGLTAVRNSDGVGAVTVALAADGVRNGTLAALPWRAPWLSVPWGIIRPSRRPPTEAEDAFLDLLRTADREAETLARQFLAEYGIEGAVG